MALDLSALEDPTEQKTNALGRPMDIPLVEIEEDPEQPRKQFDKKALEEITASIKERGVRQPISVRPHPTKPGKWMLNFGARRLRGSIAAGKESIPAFIDETSNDFDQVIENEHRDNLSPMELALFIQKKLDDGIKKAEIARKLGKDAAVITQLLALIGMPECVDEIYRSGKCISPKTLYDLRSIHKKFPTEVEEWCRSALEVTRTNVAELAARLKATKPSSDAHRARNAAPIINDNLPSHKTPALGQDQGYAEARSEADQPLKQPVLLVEYDKRIATVLLNQPPSRPGMIHIRYQDDNVDEEVPGMKCRISQLLNPGTTSQHNT